MKLGRVQHLQQPQVLKRESCFVIVALIFVIASTGAFLCSVRAEKQSYRYYALKRPDAQLACDFVLKDQDGNSFSLGSLRGKFVLLTFGFTSCPNICPTILANLARSYELLPPEEQARVQVLFISVDPSRDTPKVLNTYVSSFNRHFRGLTGPPEQIATVAKAYGVQYLTNSPAGAASKPSSYNIEHTDTVYLISPSGKWIGLYGNRQLQNTHRIADDLHHFLALFEEKNDDWQSEGGKVIKAQALSGQQLYVQECAACHLESGRGIPGKYPPLAGSDWVTGAPNRLTTLVVNGMAPTTKGGKPSFAGVMPAWRSVMTPADTAAVLTYIRQAWGNSAPAISTSYVQDLTYRSSGRIGFWSSKELEALPPDTNATSGL